MACPNSIFIATRQRLGTRFKKRCDLGGLSLQLCVIAHKAIRLAAHSQRTEMDINLALDILSIVIVVSIALLTWRINHLEK